MINDIAGRYVKMCTTFDLLKKSYTITIPFKQSKENYPTPKENEDHLITHLKFMVDKKIVNQEFKTRTGEIHRVNDKLSGAKDNRHQLPSTILNAIKELNNSDLWYQEKVELKWISCYLEGVHPDKTQNGWEKFECSHRCIEYEMEKYFCVDAKCLTWESKSKNQSRGYSTCTKRCSHIDCDKIVCVCQNMHYPPCI